MYKLPEKDVSGKYILHIIKRHVQLFRVHPSIELQRCHLHTSHHMHISHSNNNESRQLLQVFYLIYTIS